MKYNSCLKSIYMYFKHLQSAWFVIFCSLMCYMYGLFVWMAVHAEFLWFYMMYWYTMNPYGSIQIQCPADCIAAFRLHFSLCDDHILTCKLINMYNGFSDTHKKYVWINDNHTKRCSNHNCISVWHININSFRHTSCIHTTYRITKISCPNGGQMIYVHSDFFRC